jgi:crotonobetainyl-CoA hydratase
MEAVLTGNPITAAQALQWGLVNRLSPSGSSLSVALELAQEIARNPVEAVNQSKLLMHKSESFGSTWDSDYWALNDEIAAKVYSSPEASEGLQSFVEKRKPNWKV